MRRRRARAAAAAHAGYAASVGDHPDTPDAAVWLDPHVLVVTLMVFLGAIEYRGWNNLGDDGSAEHTRFVETLQ